MTQACNKQLLPVYDKPLIYYPLSTLMLAGIRDILLITSASEIGKFQRLIGDGSQFGINVQYEIQPAPEGLAQAFLIGESFIDGEPVALILGDNIFHGDGLAGVFQDAASIEHGATVFAYEVSDPERYGVIQLDSCGNPIAIIEKPQTPISNYAVPGIYFFDERVVEIAQGLKPSPRGELEITDVIQHYLDDGTLSVQRFSRGIAWLDTGTPLSMLQASNFIAAIEQRQGLRICCPEEIAVRMGFIRPEELASLAASMKSDYGRYLRSIASQMSDAPVASAIG